jgi:hypothetical protein
MLLIRPVNLPSRGVASKLGMRPERETLFHELPHIVFSVARGAGHAADREREGLEPAHRS